MGFICIASTGESQDSYYNCIYIVTHANYTSADYVLMLHNYKEIQVTMDKFDEFDKLISVPLTWLIANTIWYQYFITDLQDTNIDIKIMNHYLPKYSGMQILCSFILLVTIVIKKPAVWYLSIKTTGAVGPQESCVYISQTPLVTVLLLQLKLPMQITSLLYRYD